MENTNVAAAPTGCFKCGRPGHWSRDCPSSSSSSTPLAPPSNPNFSSYKSTGGGGVKKPVSGEKPKKIPRTRPKLTPELLLSDDGIGFVLRHFPRSFKYHGRGHEVRDLGNLIRLYSEWHSHLLPYYSFDQFVHKTEQVATTKRVKKCIGELRERVAKGGDPTRLHEAPTEYDDPTDAQAPAEAMGVEEQIHHHGDQSSNIQTADNAQEDLLNDIYKKATEEPSLASHGDMVAGEPLSAGSRQEKSPNQASNGGSKVDITEEQRARMEANRLKALQRAAVGRGTCFLSSSGRFGGGDVVPSLMSSLDTRPNLATADSSSMQMELGISELGRLQEVA